MGFAACLLAVVAEKDDSFRIPMCGQRYRPASAVLIVLEQYLADALHPAQRRHSQPFAFRLYLGHIPRPPVPIHRVKHIRPRCGHERTVDRDYRPFFRPLFAPPSDSFTVVCVEGGAGSDADEGTTGSEGFKSSTSPKETSLQRFSAFAVGSLHSKGTPFLRGPSWSKLFRGVTVIMRSSFSWGGLERFRRPRARPIISPVR